jgi:hypothetical protein
MKAPHKPICYLKNTYKYIRTSQKTSFQLHQQLFKENTRFGQNLGALNLRRL